MKKIIIYFLLIIFISLNIPASAQKYTEQQKQQIYDMIIQAYIINSEANFQKAGLPKEVKDLFINHVKENINREELIKSTWYCVEPNYKVNPQAFRNCLNPWYEKQKILFEEDIAVESKKLQFKIIKMQK